MTPDSGLVVTSVGLWRQRKDIATAIAAAPHLQTGAMRHADAGHKASFVAVGWGEKPSARRAAWLARRGGGQAVRLEDALLKGFDSRFGEPSHGYVVDQTGIYFNTGADSDFSRLLDEPCAAQDRMRAQSAMDALRDARISKFNNWQAPAAPMKSRPYLLLVDQVAGDASVAGAGAGPATYGRMIEDAADEAAGRALVVRCHPAATGTSPLVQAAKARGIAVEVASGCNPWLQVEGADAVYTISSQIGFEALLAGKTVVAYGRAFYAGHGLTQDRFAPSATRPLQEKRASLPHLFHTFYNRYSVFLDLHSRQVCSFETALDQAIVVRNQRYRLPRRVHTIGLSPWKRRALAPLLTGCAGRPRHHFKEAAARQAVRRDQGELMRWSVPVEVQVTAGHGDPILMVEDGFIRSVGLGAALNRPGSVCCDRQACYFDARAPSELEALLEQGAFPPAVLEQAARLRQLLVEQGITKYNVGGDAAFDSGSGTRQKILVVGQVADDRSVQLGSPVVRTNHALVAAVRRLYPDGHIVYKPHPDVEQGYRDGGPEPREQDQTARQGDILSWIDWADRVETMSSLSGFEALLRGKPVGVHGLPFYSGWGLTDDRLPHPRRTRRLLLDELVAGALLHYPFYVHLQSGLPVSALDFAATLARRATNKEPAA